ncbi:MAG: NTP transferase domain-containing protein [Coriobacteriales bacterium]|jgi:CTP:molybdopterin cytidylyltransferase MocA|nr:NTP transferase domain-containing protein [Coriobacteriales bacterium]
MLLLLRNTSDNRVSRQITHAMPYTTIMTNVAAIIPVAGLSSRMGSFKPLLTLNGFPMIQLTVQSALDSGAERVCVITGRQAQEVEAALLDVKEGRGNRPCTGEGLGEGPDESLVRGLAAPLQPEQGQCVFVYNAAYAASDMFESVRLGLEALRAPRATADDGAASLTSPAFVSATTAHATTQTSDTSPQAVFVLPGDMPGVSPRTFVALLERWEQDRSAVLVPSYQGRRGHPLLIDSACFDALRGFAGRGGLKQALAQYTWQELVVDDPGILLDADDPAALERLERHVRKTRGVSEALAGELFAQYETPSNVHDHTRAVAELAQRMARALDRLHYGFDTELCRSAGELHDLNRLEPDHSQVAAAHLHELGYEALARIVAAHDRELKLSPRLFTETNLVFVADKLVKNTSLVSIERRYAGALKRFAPSTEIGALIQKDRESVLALLTRYVQLTGDAAVLQGEDRAWDRARNQTDEEIERGDHADA